MTDMLTDGHTTSIPHRPPTQYTYYAYYYTQAHHQKVWIDTRFTHFIVNAVEESRDHGEDGGLQGLHVVGQLADVSLEEAHATPGTIQHRLEDDNNVMTSVKRPPREQNEHEES